MKVSTLIKHLSGYHKDAAVECVKGLDGFCLQVFEPKDETGERFVGEINLEEEE